jgi:hypothetical protein
MRKGDGMESRSETRVGGGEEVFVDGLVNGVGEVALG